MVTKSEWIIQYLKALNGNILITGSIGSGKTQGTILPYFDQLLANLDPKPSVLAIDPKGTFVPHALEIAERHNLSHQVLHLKIGGNVTFNPIFEEKALKGSKFLGIAQMIRAASANYDSQSGKHDAFWENSSYNLIKSCLIYCAAVHDYYTLKDLYSVMVRAGDEETCEVLRKEGENSEKFDEEEAANIEFAVEYFSREYGQLEDKVRTSILATGTSFLNQFQEYQANRLFCPKKEDCTLKSMREVIDEGKILLFDVNNPGLARSMGTFVKLHFEQALLNRLSDATQSKKRCGLLLIDEYQDVVTTGSGGILGDGGFLAKGREGNTITVAATQSLTSLESAVGREKSARELIQNFRTRIALHSSDLSTIHNFQELAGQEEREKKSHSISEQSHHTKRNLVSGGFDSKDANISESISTTDHKEYLVTAQDFNRLNSFEAFALVYDGVGTAFKKLCLKPYYLKKKNTPHLKVLESLRAVVVFAVLLAGQMASAFPNVCTVMKTDEFKSCLDFSVGVCMCGIPPHPCAKFEYYVPQTFIEVMPDPKSSYFGSLPGTAIQLGGLTETPYGKEADNDTQSYHAHTLAVPFAMIPFSLLPCGGARLERFCFDGMSEHLGMNWNTGGGDLLQPQFLAWSLSPKACLIKGAVTSAVGGSSAAPHPGSPICSFPMSWLPKYPPSAHEACNGWGIFYPRVGTYHGPSQTIGALMVASRMKSLSTEVFNSTPSSPDEKWQMIYPQSSSCFREGQNIGLLETIKNARETGRLTSGKLKGYLFVVWSKVSCCQELAEVPYAFAAIEAMGLACKGLGAL